MEPDKKLATLARDAGREKPKLFVWGYSIIPNQNKDDHTDKNDLLNCSACSFMLLLRGPYGKFSGQS